MTSDAALNICSCFYNKDAVSMGDNPVDKDCRTKKAVMPNCNDGVNAAGDNLPIANPSIPFDFAAGVGNSVVENTTNPAVANCYAKFENWLAGNMGGSIAVLVI